MNYLLKRSTFIIIFLIYCHANFLDLKPAIQTELNTNPSKLSAHTPDNITEPENIIHKLKNSISSQDSFFYILLLSFLAGIFISFTPCVYPMIPITAGILQTQATTSMSHNFLSSLFYVLGMAVIYAGLGVMSATTSIVFGQWTSNPIFIFFIVLLFLFLAFSLFGFYEIKMPQFLTRTQDSQIQGSQTKTSLPKSFLLGFFSGAIASPCITPALAILLTFVADKGNPVLGFFALFIFALGMGTLLIIIGTASSSLNALPRSGEWMLKVKEFIGFLMIAMSIYFCKPLISAKIAFMLYLSLSIFILVFYGIKIVQNIKKHQTPKSNNTSQNPH
ncbi:MAG: Thiol:disulfide interchange protein [candidate division TM6 bacterium GW2011_GWF2_37_49]|nr:MAG: Thiol:disulfide interchange protein [candidate division TM6 bacterium GW2011_GWF2_37_49]